MPTRLARRLALAASLLLLAPAPSLRAQTQEPVDRAVVSRIREEAFERSQVMRIASMLTDRYGPRLTGSPAAVAGGDWVIATLRNWGIPSGRMEPWGPFGRGWTNERTSVHVVAPVTFPVIATPSAWTPGTNGPVTADVVMIQADSAADLARYRGQLRGKVVMYTPMRAVNPYWEPLARRFTEAELLRMADAPLPAPPGGGPGGGPGGNPAFAAMQALNTARTALLREEGVTAVLMPNRGDGGTVFVSGGGGSRDPANPAAFPTVVLGIEHYGRIARLLEMGETVRMELDIRNTFHDDNLNSFNVIAEIPGTDKAEELVIIGAHFDTWHGGTGATDNSSGSAVMIEAMRILKALDLPLRRTVRLGLWMGEEQGLIGSRMYVEEHFGNAQGARKPAQARVSAYFNMDNGTGAFRGVYLQGNEAVAPIFRAWLAPFTDRGVTTLTRANTGGTDHLSFDRVGIPGFQFIQDPMEYSTRSHHSTMDTFERLQADDLMLNAAVVAAFVYHAANREALLPRKP
jgi:carboxypeptidase Q